MQMIATVTRVREAKPRGGKSWQRMLSPQSCPFWEAWELWLHNNRRHRVGALTVSEAEMMWFKKKKKKSSISLLLHLLSFSLSLPQKGKAFFIFWIFCVANVETEDPLSPPFHFQFHGLFFLFIFLFLFTFLFFFFWRSRIFLFLFLLLFSFLEISDFSFSFSFTFFFSSFFFLSSFLESRSRNRFLSSPGALIKAPDFENF